MLAGATLVRDQRHAANVLVALQFLDLLLKLGDPLLAFNQ
jgi:hypothetical protein